MKKLLATVALALAFFTASAQTQDGLDPRFFNNQFTSIGGGLAFYNNEAGVSTGWNGQFTVGNWILDRLAMRVALEGVGAANSTGNNVTIAMASVDFLWDVMSVATGRFDAKRVFSVYPIIGLGCQARLPFTMAVKDENGNMVNKEQRIDPDFHALAGLDLEFRVPKMSSWPFFLEGRMYLFPQGYDFNRKNASIFNLTAGIRHEINYDPHHRRIVGESRGPNYDWFAGVAAGPMMSIYGFDSEDLTIKDHLGWNADITFGRNFSTLWTIRFGLGMGGATNPKDVYSFYNLRADLMFNVSNLHGLQRGRRLNILPYAGAGIISRFDLQKILTQADAGLMARLYVNTKLDLYADARYVLVTPGFIPEKFLIDDGLWNACFPQLSLGAIYNFEPTSGRYRGGSRQRR